MHLYVDFFIFGFLNSYFSCIKAFTVITRIVANSIPEEKQRDCESKVVAPAHVVDLANARICLKFLICSNSFM